MKNQREINQFLLNHLTEIMENSKEENKIRLQGCCDTLEAGEKLNDGQKAFLKQINAI